METNQFKYPGEVGYAALRERLALSPFPLKAAEELPKESSPSSPTTLAASDDIAVVVRYATAPSREFAFDNARRDEKFFLSSNPDFEGGDAAARMYQVLLNWFAMTRDGKVGAFFFCWECEDFVLKEDFLEGAVRIDPDAKSWKCPRCDKTTARVPWDVMRHEIRKMIKLGWFLDFIEDAEEADLVACEKCDGTGTLINRSPCGECGHSGLQLVELVEDEGEQVNGNKKEEERTTENMHNVP